MTTNKIKLYRLDHHPDDFEFRWKMFIRGRIVVSDCLQSLIDFWDEKPITGNSLTEGRTLIGEFQDLQEIIDAFPEEFI